MKQSLLECVLGRLVTIKRIENTLSCFHIFYLNLSLACVLELPKASDFLRTHSTPKTHQVSKIKI